MSFESFYGGRMGASFVIVKSFDGIDIPNNDSSHIVYKAEYLAVSGTVIIDNEEQYIYKIENGNFIKKDQAHYKDNCYWILTALNGEDVYISASGEKKQLDKIKAEGMVQCFDQGVSTTNTVNYNEYVIIDTADKNDPDNGKVFRRRMDTGGDPRGADYIGQIVGPQGPAPEVAMEHYDIIKDGSSDKYYHKLTLDYTPNQDLIPGVISAEGSVTTFNDNIQWITASLRDQWGNVNNCVVGFKIPYLVLEFEGNSIDPYSEDYRQGSVGNWSYHNLVAKDTGENGFDPSKNAWKHPFFEKWQVKVPPGLHGINSTNIEIVHTRTMPQGFKKDFAGTKYYSTPNCEETSLIDTLTNSVDVLRDEENVSIRVKDDEGHLYQLIYDVTTPSCQIRINNQISYVKKEDCYMDIIRYKETNFDNYKDGEITFYNIGDKNDIQRITLSETGILTAYYSGFDAPQILNNDNPLKWFKDPEENGIKLDDDGTLTFTYNTNEKQIFSKVIRWLYKNDDPEHPVKGIDFNDDGTVTITYNITDEHNNRQQEIYSNLITWIEDISLSEEGAFEVLFNNTNDGKFPNKKYITTLEWINAVRIDTDGTIKFYLNTQNPDDESEEPKYKFDKILKIINNIEIQTIDTTLPIEKQVEGTGDQKVHITYNTEEAAIIGNPLNYIIETVVVSSSINPVEYPDAKYSHLLVYYSDPALRQSLQDKWVKYPSQKYPGKVWTEWVDLGDIRGSQNGIHIITNVTDMNDLKDTEGHWIPPEQLKNTEGQVIVPNAAGWNVTFTYIDISSGDTITELLAYDYNTKEWYSIGSIDSSLVNPKNSIVVSPRDDNYDPIPADVANLQNGGIWFATETQYYAY